MALDIFGQLPELDLGKKYILIIGDYFSKWTEAYAIPDREATTVVIVLEFMAHFGILRQIHSDQGKNFELKVFQEMCKSLGMDKTRTTPLQPQSDGMIERFNQTIEEMLSMFVAENQRDWAGIVTPILRRAYCSNVHESTSDLLIDLQFGRPDQKW